MAVLGTIIPPVLIIMLVSYFYDQFRNNPYVDVAMMGMLAGVAAVILDVSINMLKMIIKQKKILPIFIFLGAFIAVFLFKVNILYIILSCILIGIIVAFYQTYQEKKKKDNLDKSEENLDKEEK